MTEGRSATIVRSGLLLLCLHSYVQLCGQIVKNKVLRHEVRFANGRSELNDSARAVLGTICADIANRENYTIRLIGNTDSVGNYGYNLDLSIARAKTTREHLIGCGAAPERITSDGASFTKPKASNATDLGKAKNRRTTVAVTLIYFPVSALEPVEALRPGATLDLNVLFKFNRAEFQPGATKNLDKVIELLHRYPDLHFEIMGWTAISQSSGDLSGERAKAVYVFLKEHGIAPERMSHKGMGGGGCAAKMIDKCRRVEIAITRNPYLKRE